MNNVSTQMIALVAGLVLAAGVGGYALTASTSGTSDGNKANAKVEQVGAKIQDSDITRYEGKTVKGSEVVAAVQSLESENVVIRVNNGTQIVTYDPNDPNNNDISRVLGELRSIGTDTYVSDEQLFDGTIVYDEDTGAIKELLFNTSGGGVRNNANFNTDVNENLVNSDSVYIDYYVNNGTNAIYYNDYVAQKGVADNIITDYPTEAYYQGHEFQGWSQSKTGGTIYKPGQSITFDSDTSMYAVWKTKTYTIKFDANGGTGAPSDITKTWGVNVTVPSTQPTRSNTEFVGWSKKSTGTAIYAKAGDTITADENVTLYAVYRNSTYTITYMPNGGVGSSYTQPAPANENVDLYLNQFQPNGEKRFIGWGTTAGSNTVVYGDGQTLYSVTGNMTLYAIWEPISKITVTYDLNGGDYGPENETVEAGLYHVSGTTPTKNGMKFTGWLGNDGLTYSPGSSISLSQNLTLTAQWSSTTRTYTVRHIFMNLNGEYDTTDSNLVKEETRTTSNFTVTPNAIYREGFEQPDEDTMVPVSVAADGSTVIEYRYPRIKHKVTFELVNSDKGDAGKIKYSPNKTDYYFDEDINADVDLNMGYEFIQWDSNYKNVKDEPKKTTFTVDEFTTLYKAKVQARKFNITYVLNGGENGKDNPNFYKMPFSQRINPASRIGYTFHGWSGSNTAKGWGINADGTANPHLDNHSMENDFYFVIPAGIDYHLTFTANFTVNHYKVTFNPNGATGSPYTTGSYEYDKKEAMPANRFTYANHTFMGWNTKADGTGLDITEIYKLSPDDNANVQLYAMWTGVPAAEVNESRWVQDPTPTPGTTIPKNPQIHSVSSWASYGLLRVAIPRAVATVSGGTSQRQDLATLSGLNTTNYVLLKQETNDDYHIFYYGYNGVISSYGTTPELFTGLYIPNFTAISGSKQVSVDVTAFICRKTDFTSVQDAFNKGMLFVPKA